jgi:hypothetical protein
MFRELNVCFIGQASLTKDKDAVFVGGSNEFIGDIFWNWTGKVDSPDFSSKRFVQWNEFKRHLLFVCFVCLSFETGEALGFYASERLWGNR